MARVHDVLCHPCPYCGVRNDAATHASGPQPTMPPRAGDRSVCAACSGLAVFVDTGFGTIGVRPATEAEIARFASDPEGRRVYWAVARARATTGPPPRPPEKGPP